MANKAPAPNRRPLSPFGTLGEFDYPVCALPVWAAAIGEARTLAGMHGGGGRFGVPALAGMRKYL